MRTPGRLRPVLSLVALAVAGSGACRSAAPPPPPLSEDPAVEAFARDLESRLEAHAWDDVLALAHRAHHRVQVEEHGMPQPQYVAELFGLHRVGNSIRRGEAVTWADLERIEDVRLREIAPTDGRWTLSGDVRTAGGRSLRLEAWIIETDDGLRLSGGVG